MSGTCRAYCREGGATMSVLFIAWVTSALVLSLIAALLGLRARRTWLDSITIILVAALFVCFITDASPACTF